MYIYFYIIYFIYFKMARIEKGKICGFVAQIFEASKFLRQSINNKNVFTQLPFDCFLIC